MMTFEVLVVHKRSLQARRKTAGYNFFLYVWRSTLLPDVSVSDTPVGSACESFRARFSDRYCVLFRRRRQLLRRRAGNGFRECAAVVWWGRRRGKNTHAARAHTHADAAQTYISREIFRYRNQYFLDRPRSNIVVDAAAAKAADAEAAAAAAAVVERRRIQLRCPGKQYTRMTY